MKIRLLLLALLSAGLAVRTVADEPAKEETPHKQATKEEIEARLADHIRKKEAKAAAEKAAAAKTTETAKADAAATAAPVASTTPATPTPATKDDAAKAATPAKPAAEPAQVLPTVDIKRGRVTEFDIQLAKQNVEIAREKANAKPTKLDEALNGPKISGALAIFGGQSSDDRANVAKERIAMMEDEKDILEAIAQAQTKEEKTELENLLAQMKATRRELEQSLK